MKKNGATGAKFKKLCGLFENKINMLIVLQDNPDPDSISAAVALRKLANGIAEIQCSIAHGGTVGRAENRALVAYLNLNLRDIQQLDLARFDLIAMVDTQPQTGNNSLPAEYLPDIVIDHHAVKRLTRSCPFIDIRSRYGATCTILLEYMNQAGMLPDTAVATAMLYAIKSDTQDLGRDATRTDVDAIIQLYPLANKRMLGEIQRGRVDKNYFKLLSTALRNARVYDQAVIVELGNLENPDMIAEIADLLIRQDHIVWSMSYGIVRGTMNISLRTTQDQLPADKVIKLLVAKRGTGGGHFSYAGGQIPLRESSDQYLRLLEKAVRTKFLKLVGASRDNPQKLI
jgi:nanoRNase/pAp phosphatase (c-di-AMP/oligoRNAs hydrolase)